MQANAVEFTVNMQLQRNKLKAQWTKLERNGGTGTVDTGQKERHITQLKGTAGIDIRNGITRTMVCRLDRELTNEPSNLAWHLE